MERITLVLSVWQWMILYYLKDKNKRFSELRKDMPHITEMALSIQLKKLEKDGLILRDVYGDKPPIKVVYSLTDFGKSLKPVFESLSVWLVEVSKDA
ncbi:winged helix-turn-helix transcriptional regulator [Xenorhabdus szentirmaii]|uniref:winged helix-turn-helix transcriptional regulator n=1 Tax=Xenorhabdus szentirmaii TaxID=290112 RepID=UPI002B4025C2|nr:winged helix-turn-helix transcriptional regulator [Xenorhabdus sp. M]